MGILYDEAIRKFYIEELRALNVTTSQTGKSIMAMDKEELHYEYVLATFREIDRNNESGRWF